MIKPTPRTSLPPSTRAHSHNTTGIARPMKSLATRWCRSRTIAAASLEPIWRQYHQQLYLYCSTPLSVVDAVVVAVATVHLKFLALQFLLEITSCPHRNDGKALKWIIRSFFTHRQHVNRLPRLLPTHPCDSRGACAASRQPPPPRPLPQMRRLLKVRACSRSCALPTAAGYTQHTHERLTLELIALRQCTPPAPRVHQPEVTAVINERSASELPLAGSSSGSDDAVRYSLDLLQAFPAVCHKAKSGVQTCHVVVAFVQERAAMETAYAKALQHVAQYVCYCVCRLLCLVVVVCMYGHMMDSTRVYMCILVPLITDPRMETTGHRSSRARGESCKRRLRRQRSSERRLLPRCSCRL